MKREPIIASLFISLFSTFQLAQAQSSFVVSTNQQIGNGTTSSGSAQPGGQAGTYVGLTTVTSFPQLTSCVGCSLISLNQFAAATDLNNDILGVNASIAGVSSSLAASLAGVNLAMQNLKKEGWTGTALAASLTPTLPTDGNQNHINLSAAAAGDTQAVSINYSHVDGPYDIMAGAAISRNYSLAKVGIGFSW